MTSMTLHPLPPTGEVLSEQFRTIGIANRREMAILVTVFIVFGGLTFLGANRVWYLSNFPVHTTLIGLFAPFGVWKALDPSRRAYFWALPVDHAQHSLMRVLLGWVWLMGLVAVLLAAHLIAFALTDVQVTLSRDLIDVVAARMIQAPTGSVETPLAGHGWYWIVPFTSATIAYLCGSVALLWTDHPFIWYAVIGVTGGILGEAGMPTRQLVWSILGDKYGITGWMTGFSNQPHVMINPLGQRIEGVLNQLDPQAWLIASLLWGSAAVAAVLLAAYRGQER